MTEAQTAAQKSTQTADPSSAVAAASAPGEQVITATRRMLLVHAHPDDETIGSGTLMAKYAAQGAHVTLVTCTLGEEGEILLPAIEHLAADRDDALGPYRIGELADAMRALGVSDHRFLGGAGKYRDSGMVGLPQNANPDCFWQADLLAAANELVPVIREVRPQVVVTYDEFGAYGHPDHIQAHRVATYAVDLAGAPSYRQDLGSAWQVPKVYWTALPRSVLRQGILALRAAGDDTGFAAMDPDNLLMGVEDDMVTTRFDGADFIEHKLEAMRAHASQISVAGPFFALSNKLGSAAMGVEYFRLVRGELAPELGERYETDLFAGLGI